MTRTRLLLVLTSYFVTTNQFLFGSSGGCGGGGGCGCAPCAPAAPLIPSCPQPSCKGPPICSGTAYSIPASFSPLPPTSSSYQGSYGPPITNTYQPPQYLPSDVIPLPTTYQSPVASRIFPIPPPMIPAAPPPPPPPPPLPPAAFPNYMPTQFVTAPPGYFVEVAPSPIFMTGYDSSVNPTMLLSSELAQPPAAIYDETAPALPPPAPPPPPNVSTGPYSTETSSTPIIFDYKTGQVVDQTDSPIPILEDKDTSWPGLPNSNQRVGTEGFTPYDLLQRRHKVLKRMKNVMTLATVTRTNNTCNSMKLANVMVKVMGDDVSASKAAIQRATELSFDGAKFDVFCASGEFSYSIHSRKYCEVTRENVTCFAFR